MTLTTIDLPLSGFVKLTHCPQCCSGHCSCQWTWEKKGIKKGGTYSSIIPFTCWEGSDHQRRWSVLIKGAFADWTKNKKRLWKTLKQREGEKKGKKDVCDDKQPLASYHVASASLSAANTTEKSTAARKNRATSMMTQRKETKQSLTNMKNVKKKRCWWGKKMFLMVFLDLELVMEPVLCLQ